MIRLFVVACFAAGSIGSTHVAAHGYDTGDIQVRHPWTRATPLGTSVGAGYLEIRNSGRQADRLMGASTPAGERVELHALTRDGDVVRMRQVKSFELPARRRLTLRPGGPHLMIVGLPHPFEKGQRIPLTLHFERAGALRIELEVQASDARKPHH